MSLVTLVLFAGAGIAAALLALRVRALGRKNAALEDRIRLLSKYEGIVDAETRAASIASNARLDAAKIISEATATAQRLHGEAEAKLRAVGAEAETARAKATEEARALRLQATETLASAHAEAQSIIDTAHKKAQEIAGDAFAAKENANRYAMTAQAMKNVIEGYGDQYVVPTFSILDELAKDFGFAEAGVKLKEARAKTRSMIKEGTAAACDYVQLNRKSTAVNFVLDAFNGKVDTILSGVRHDNFGTLEQKIKDAYAIVNNNGQAFRNARITEAYFAARLDELRWAVAANELKLKEQEEQRAIRERIREEEQAQRDYERAMKEAAKEEELLKKMREKVQQEFDKASGDQKAKFEHQLSELNEKLRQAEEKNQRALSMAQQTKAGNVYVISNIGSFGEHVYKIGLTRRLEPLDRIRELGDAAVPFAFDVHAMVRSDDAPALEHMLHKTFVNAQMNKVNPRKEFFRVTLDEIRAEIERLGLQVTWTITAKAAEYRETLAIEREMQAKTLNVKDWADKQIEQRAAADLQAPQEASA